MAYRGHSDQWLVSQPHDVVWAGWRTNTWALQQEGWQLSAEQDLMNSRMRILMKHPGFRVYALTEAMGYDFFRRDFEARPLMFVCRHMAGELSITEPMNLSAFQPIDARPMTMTRQLLSQAEDEFRIFAPALTRTEEIIVEPATVHECLERIRQLQAPELAAIRERNRSRDIRNQPLPDPSQRQMVHAQIISIAA